jgi:organic hydroperoxide reductase OsmC/OhrA
VSAGSRRVITGGPPPEFDGNPEDWSPEHLLLSSAALCLMTTFLALAYKARVPLQAYHCAAEGTLDRTPEGFMFTAITLKVVLRVAPPDAEAALRTLESAKKYCIISNSLRTPVKLEARIESFQHA